MADPRAHTGRSGTTRRAGGAYGTDGSVSAESAESAEHPRPSGTANGPLFSLAVDLVLPILVYYVARALGAGQASALLLSGAPPALRLLAGAARHRRIDGVDLFFTVLLAAAALVSLIGGGPRVLLFKNAALSLAVGGWALGTAFTRRPLAFLVGQRPHRGSAVRARDRIWQDSAPFRRALRFLTALWGAEQLLDGALGSVAAATLPADTVPLLDRALSLLLLGLTAGATAVYTRRFRMRHALPLFGTPAPPTVHRDDPSPASPRPSRRTQTTARPFTPAFHPRLRQTTPAVTRPSARSLGPSPGGGHRCMRSPSGFATRRRPRAAFTLPARHRAATTPGGPHVAGPALGGGPHVADPALGFPVPHRAAAPGGPGLPDPVPGGDPLGCVRPRPATQADRGRPVWASWAAYAGCRVCGAGVPAGRCGRVAELPGRCRCPARVARWVHGPAVERGAAAGSRS